MKPETWLGRDLEKGRRVGRLLEAVRESQVAGTRVGGQVSVERAVTELT